MMILSSVLNMSKLDDAIFNKLSDDTHTSVLDSVIDNWKTIEQILSDTNLSVSASNISPMKMIK